MKDGLFHLFATDGQSSRSIVHCESENLIDYGHQQLLGVMENVDGTNNCWAPECFYDAQKQLYRIHWSSAVHLGEPDKRDHRIWATTTRDFREFSRAVEFFDPGYNVIDATIVSYDGKFVMAFKDERGENEKSSYYKAIRIAIGQEGTGPYTSISSLLTPTLTEGPILFRNEGLWVIIYDCFAEDRFGAIASADGSEWEDVTGKMTFPPSARHGSVIEVDDGIAGGLMAM